MTHAHDRLSELFQRALECPPEGRERLLAAACAGDAELRREVEDLLQHHADDAFLQRPGATAPEPGKRLGSIGPFQVLRTLGHGGMAVVYLAQESGSNRHVALKVLHPALLSPAAVRRFSHEIEYLERLQHPGIARILDAGVAEAPDGPQPWFAMEFVDGQPITRHAIERGLPLRERIELFLRVCQAVEHAHQSSIVHRDLKPENLLVDGDGEPRIIDFGVARATDADVQRTTMHTAPGQLIGTLAYMSPEQCAGDADRVDTRSDVYSLVMVLYELVCGRPPYDLAGLTLPQAAQVIQTQDPMRPGTCVPGLSRDLEAVLLKGLEKSPERRYPSVGALAEDLRRHLAGDPVNARLPTGLDRIVRWMVRHPVRTTAALCLAILAASAAGALCIVWFLALEPYRLALDADRRVAVVETRTGRALHRFDGGAAHAISVGLFLRLPSALGGGSAVALGLRECSTNPAAAGRVLFFRDLDLVAPDWSVGFEPTDLPQGEPIRPASRFGVDDLIAADVFPEPDGPELIAAYRLTQFSASAVRVIDLSGRVRFEVWHDGGPINLYWLEEPGRIVVTAW
ncbi:MAG TPA: serine/threonine-protein kinase, partial [Candidatus Polarisedimenticolia bacterium]|nr:serine/threonine-protein kinase [Candidatus Polarisedimenticolia bacterium]